MSKILNGSYDKCADLIEPGNEAVSRFGSKSQGVGNIALSLRHIERDGSEVIDEHSVAESSNHDDIKKALRH